MSELPDDRDNYCYRHPNRQSYILCQRCGRTVCPACSTQASVGVHCPECVKEARAKVPQRRPVGTRTVRAFRSGSSTPVVTYSIIAICVLVFALQLITRDAITGWLALYPPYIDLLPWTVLTSEFAHGSPIHLLVNMISLFLLGPSLELAFGRARYIALFLLSGLGGSVAVIFLLGDQASALGASGAIFGLLAALVVAIRRIGGNTTQLLILVVVNLSIGFLIPGIAWQAHVGGLIVGGVIAAIYTRTQGPRNRRRQLLLMAGLTTALVVATVVGWAIL